MTEQLSLEQLSFDYGILDAGSCNVVKQRTDEIKVLVHRTAQGVVDIGLKLIEVKDILGHNHFGPWLDSEFGWGKRQAQRFMNVADQFAGKSDKLSLFAPSALYLLAAPSTPTEAREEAVNLAMNGHNITHSTANDIINTHKRNGYYRAISLQSSDVTAQKTSDLCQTPAYALDPLLPYLKTDRVIWEPAAGEGYLVQALVGAGLAVIDSDILTGRNFFEYDPQEWDCLITNPPYSIKFPWIERCYELGKPFALLLPVETLGTKTGQKPFKRYGLELVLLPSRANFKMPDKGWESSSTFPTGWFTWGLNIGRQITYANATS